MYIKISKTDCVKIANGNLQGGGNSELEVALAKKCLALYDKLGQINNERNEYFEAIYSATVKFEKATKGTLMHKRAADIERDSKAHFAAAVRLNGELKEMMDGTCKAARERIAAEFDKRVLATPRSSDTAELRESKKRE